MILDDIGKQSQEEMPSGIEYLEILHKIIEDEMKMHKIREEISHRQEVCSMKKKTSTNGQTTFCIMKYREQIYKWLLVLLNNPFNLLFLNTKGFTTFILGDLQCAALLMSNFMKNSVNEQFYHERYIFGQHVDEVNYFKFLYFLSKKNRLSWLNNGTSENGCCIEVEAAKNHPTDEIGIINRLQSFVLPTDTEVIKSLKYKIITNQGVYNHLPKQLVLDTLFHYLKNRTTTHSLTLSYSISQFGFDLERLLDCFSTSFFCRETLWINTLLIASFRILEKKTTIDVYEGKNSSKSLSAKTVIHTILKTVFFEHKNKYAQKLREMALFFIYCVVKMNQNYISLKQVHKKTTSIVEILMSNSHNCTFTVLSEFFVEILLSVSLFDNQLDCRRAAVSIILELEATQGEKLFDFIDFFKVRRKNNTMNLDKKYFFGIVKERMIFKVFDNDLEMQIVCLEWMTNNGINLLLKQIIKKDEYDLCDILDPSYADINYAVQYDTMSLSYVTVLIAYLFLDQLEKIEIVFDNFILDDEKFYFFVDIYLKKLCFKKYDFKNSNYFYDMIDHTIVAHKTNHDSSHKSGKYNNSYMFCNEKYVKYDAIDHISEENLIFLLDNNIKPSLTMFLHGKFDNDVLFKKLLKRRNMSYFLINAFNSKYVHEYIELVKKMLEDNEIEIKKIGIRCIFVLYKLYGIEDSKTEHVIRTTLHQSIKNNLHNYTIDHRGDIGYICRQEAFFALYYINGEDINYYVLKFLFDKNKKLREILISLLCETGVFENVKNYQCVFISREKNILEHLLTNSILKNPDTDGSIHEDLTNISHTRVHGNLHKFLRALDNNYRVYSSSIGDEKAFFKSAFASLCMLDQDMKVCFSKAILSYFVNCDGFIHKMLISEVGKYLISYIPYVLSGSGREMFFGLKTVLYLMTDTYKNDDSIRTNLIKNQAIVDNIHNIRHAKLDDLKNEILKKMEILRKTAACVDL